MNKHALIRLIKEKQSFLCVGLDSDIEKIPAHLLELDDPVFAFNQAIIDATLPYAIAYKPNLAFYESMGARGWESLEKTMAYLKGKAFIIADAKRGDIGNTSKHYAKAFFENLGADAITLSPYMGTDTVAPFLEYKDKWAIVLALTSNPSAEDFQLDDQPALYEKVISQMADSFSSGQLMFVVGATRPAFIARIRRQVPHHFLLVPGIGAQGGSLEEVVKAGINDDIGLIINASRSIIFTSEGKDFAESAGLEAEKVATQMKKLLAKYKNE